MKTKQTRSSMLDAGFRRLDVGCWVLGVGLALFLSSASSASGATRYVWQDSPSPAPPYANWTSAAHVIQDAVDADADSLNNWLEWRCLTDPTNAAAAPRLFYRVGVGK